MPVTFTKIAGAEKIVHHAAGENQQRQKQALIKEEWAIQEERGAEKGEHHGGPGSDHPFDGKLKIEKRDDCGGAQVREKNVKMQAAVASRIFFFLRQLRIDEKENQYEREDSVHARPPELARFA